MTRRIREGPSGPAGRVMVPRFCNRGRQSGTATGPRGVEGRNSPGPGPPGDNGPVRYDEPLFRPPSEADSFILQATLGCSWNACTYCAMYRGKRYQVRPLEAVLAEISEAGARAAEEVRHVFVADGDPLGMDLDHWEPILKALAAAFPRLRRVGTYATARNLLEKAPEALKRLRDLGLSLLKSDFSRASHADAVFNNGVEWQLFEKLSLRLGLRELHFNRDLFRNSATWSAGFHPVVSTGIGLVPINVKVGKASRTLVVNYGISNDRIRRGVDQQLDLQLTF